MAKKAATSTKTPIKNTPVMKSVPETAKPGPAKKEETTVNKPVASKAGPAISSSPKPGKVITSEKIAQRAYEIWQSGTGTSEHDNWLRAERELRGE